MRSGMTGTAMIVLLGASLVSCGGGGAQAVANKVVERAVEHAAAKDGTDVDMDIDSDTVTMTDASGNTVTVGATSLPDGWPDTVPFEGSTTVNFSGSSTNAGKTSWSVTGTYSGVAADLYAYYKRELASWTTVTDAVVDSEGTKSYSYEATNDAYDYALFIVSQDGETNVAATLNQK